MHNHYDEKKCNSMIWYPRRIPWNSPIETWGAVCIILGIRFARFSRTICRILIHCSCKIFQKFYANIERGLRIRLSNLSHPPKSNSSMELCVYIHLKNPANKHQHLGYESVRDELCPNHEHKSNYYQFCLSIFEVGVCV